MPEPKSGHDDTMRIAFMVNNKPDLRIISVSTPLQSIIQDLIEFHKLGGSTDDYALIFKESDKIKEFRVVTEKDRTSMDANIIELAESPSASTSRILNEIKKVVPDTKEFNKALEDLRKMCVDPTFAAEFKTKKGLVFLMGGVSKGKFRNNELGHVLHAINSLLEHENMDIDGGADIEHEFVSQLADLTSKENSSLALATKCALNILATFVKDGKGKEMIDREVALPNLIGLLGNGDQGIQLGSLNLINSLLASVSVERKIDMVRSLQERPARNLIMDHLLGNDKDGFVGHQLYLLQYHMLSLLKVRLNTAIQPQDGVALQKIKDLRSTAFDTGSPSVKNNTRYAQDHKKLGFNNIKDPSMDFVATPPGILALDCMDYFAKHHQEKFMKVVLENSCRQDSHECPFASSSCELVKLLANILGVGQPSLPISNLIQYHEMFFKVEHPFEEFYSVCVVLLNKTWREMRATKEDFTKVFDVVKEQIESSLVPERPQERPKTFEAFRSNVKSYGEISRRWQSDAKSREAWSKSAPVAELKLHLAPEIEDLIRQQRGNFMVEGTRFHRFKKTGEQTKSQYRYVKLHPNLKTVYIGDWNSEKSLPTIEELEPRLQIADIRDIIVGAECQFIKEWGKKKDHQHQYSKLAFSLIGENTSLDLVAPDEQTHNYWIDGINTLLRRPMTSSDYQKEKEILTNMEIKLRLLDLEGVELPEVAPTVPELPPDFNFASC